MQETETRMNWHDIREERERTGKGLAEIMKERKAKTNPEPAKHDAHELAWRVYRLNLLLG